MRPGANPVPGRLLAPPKSDPQSPDPTAAPATISEATDMSSIGKHDQKRANLPSDSLRMLTVALILHLLGKI